MASYFVVDKHQHEQEMLDIGRTGGRGRRRRRRMRGKA
jgi:hypothetical protein